MTDLPRAHQAYIDRLTNEQKIAYTCVAIAYEQTKKAAEYLPFVKTPPPVQR